MLLFYLFFLKIVIFHSKSKRKRENPHLQGKGAQDHAAEDGVPVDALKHVPLAMDLPGVDFIEELHHDEDVEDDGVVLRGRRVQGCVAAAVDVKELLSCEATMGVGRSLSLPVLTSKDGSLPP